jgi:Transposase DDE domain
MRTIQEEEVDLTEHEDFGDAMKGLGRFLDDVKNRKRTLLAGVLDPGRVRATRDRHATLAEISCNACSVGRVVWFSGRTSVVLVTDCASHLVLAAVPGRGPASDLVLFRTALKQAVGRAWIGTLLADADFDAEWVHEEVRSYGIRTLIPPKRGRPSEKPPAGKWRRRLKQLFNKKKYGQRWQTETVNSMIKRRLGSALRARGYWSQCREIILRVITHNVMIVIRIRVFYKAAGTPFRRRLAGAKSSRPGLPSARLTPT